MQLDEVNQPGPQPLCVCAVAHRTRALYRVHSQTQQQQRSVVKYISILHFPFPLCPRLCVASRFPFQFPLSLSPMALISYFTLTLSYASSVSHFPISRFCFSFPFPFPVPFLFPSPPTCTRHAIITSRNLLSMCK